MSSKQGKYSNSSKVPPPSPPTPPCLHPGWGKQAKHVLSTCRQVAGKEGGRAGPLPACKREWLNTSMKKVEEEKGEQNGMNSRPTRI